MAENRNNTDFVIWHASAHAGEGPFPNSREGLFTEAIEVLEGELAAASGAAIYWRNVASRNASKVIKARRQRNVLAGVLTSIIVSSYLKARERHESRRVNPNKVDYTGRM